MLRLDKKTYIFLSTILLAACASMPSDFQQPAFSIMNIELRNSSGLSPEFEVTLRITNPNRVALDIVGMSYDILLEGNKVVSGVSNDFPEIEPYGEDTVSVKSQISLLGSINLLRDLARRNNDLIRYEFNARLDIGSHYQIIPIAKSGNFAL
jgi:LEA14-like dessication related protein